VETHELKSVSKKAETTAEKLKAIYLADPEFNRTKVANLLGVSRRQIIRLVNEFQNPEKK
jgi:DNA-binding transcriptional regulator LsrR (DeoR family)